MQRVEGAIGVDLYISRAEQITQVYYQTLWCRRDMRQSPIRTWWDTYHTCHTYRV